MEKASKMKALSESRAIINESQKVEKTLAKPEDQLPKS